jgi:hypothetical protein
VLGLAMQEAFGNQQREVAVLVVGSFEAVVEFALDELPNGVPIGLDDHAAFDDLGGFGHIALHNDVLIPGGEVLPARSDGRFGHRRVSSRVRHSKAGISRR